MKDEGPSEDDLKRFSGDDGYCPECGEPTWDQAQFCPACGSQLDGQTLSRPPQEHEGRKNWIIIVSVIVLIAFFLVVTGGRGLF